MGQDVAPHPKHCHVCGRRLWGRGWVYAPDGTPDEPWPEGGRGQALVVCRRCHRNAARCDGCGIPVGENQVCLPDGRNICARCHQTAIYDQARAQELFERVADVITDRLGLGLNVGTDFTLVDHRHLQRLVTESAGDLPEDASKVVGLFARKGRQRVMYLLFGMPQIVLIQVTAHEWAHAWQGENCPLLRDSLVREGFAEWVAYKTLQIMGAVKKVALMEQQDSIYGEGLREMLALERQVGVAGVLDFCRRSE
jgi:hypothetical protein